MSRLTVVDVFSGIGGLSLGFEEAAGGAFKCIAGVEQNPHHREVFKQIHPYANTEFHDVTATEGRSISQKLGLAKGELDVLIGGPPCQAFSMAGKRRGLRDERGRLVHHFVRLVEELRPRAFVMENVLGLLSIHNGRLVSEILKELSNLRYELADEPEKVNAADFGVPQIRRRIFIVGLWNGPLFNFPERTHRDGADASAPLPFDGKDECEPYVTVDEAISDLPCNGDSEDSREDDGSALPYLSGPNSNYQRAMRCGNRKGSVTGNRVSVHFDHIRDVIDDLDPGEEEPSTRYRRLYPDRPAFTLRAGSGTFTALRPIHPDRARVITIREAARLQSFPDRIDFSNVKKWAYQAIGNSVPPLLAQKLAMQLGRYLI